MKKKLCRLRKEVVLFLIALKCPCICYSQVKKRLETLTAFRVKVEATSPIHTMENEDFTLFLTESQAEKL